MCVSYGVISSMGEPVEFSKLPLEKQNEILKLHYSNHVKSIEQMQKQIQDLVNQNKSLQLQISAIQAEKSSDNTEPMEDDDFPAL